MSLLYHGVWKSQKKSHFTTSRTKRATFIFSPSIDDLEPFLCFEVNTDHENWPFNFVNIKGLQVWSVLFSLHKKGFKPLIEGQENESYEMLVSVWKFKWDIFQWICNIIMLLSIVYHKYIIYDKLQSSSSKTLLHDSTTK